MDPVQTLHDFTLNLLSDPQARSAFQSDPQGAVNTAGLGDLNAGDVHEILPLVLDYAPAQGLGDLDSTLDLLSSDNALDLLGDSPLTLGQDVLGQGIEDNTATAPLAGVAAAAQHLAGDTTADLADTLDADVLNTVADTTTHGNVTDVVGDLTAEGLPSHTDLLETTHLSGTVEDVTTGLHGDSSIDDRLTGDHLTGDIGDVTDNALGIQDVVQTGDVLSDVGHLGDVTTTVGDITHVGNLTDVANSIGNVDVGGVFSGNGVDF
ncbi:IniB N-terminal domain-containing protein [Saccharothrix hoggarensis]|uniref:IniB N-terminal domain-containing protein n=1 Tax=Saccharothrix hoggarensis TaxID=913853 RepID=A0ABW3QIG8_9PSEU